MTRSKRIRLLAVIDAVALLTLAALLGSGYRQAMQASGHYEQVRARLTADIKAAQQDGLPEAALVPITSKLSSLDRGQPSLWPDARTNFYVTGARTAEQLDVTLASERQAALADSKGNAGTQMTEAQTAIDHDQQVELPDSSLSTYRQRLAAIRQAAGAAQKIKDWQSLAAQAKSLLDEAVAAGVAQEQVNAAIQQAATALLQQSGGNIGAIQQAGNTALSDGRNDATVAAYEAKPGRFANITALTVAYNQAEHYAARLTSADVKQVAYGSAGIRHYAGQVHQMLLQGLGPKHIIVSFQAQRAWAYENGKVVMDTLVTTGIRGATAFGTDFGPMKVLFLSHPYTMRSPWPKGSIYWYPNTVVQWTTFFTPSESFHDASWEPDSLLGPGSQFNASTRSHGCIHLPYGLAQWMFGWASEGTPVDVVPGNGQPLAEQLSEMTTDNQGNPGAHP